ncbi:MAG: BatD family protein [candidate division KSB1 bacterium]|nr:BatD family protein [candidate division KSB1 bacterium]MDZ7356393.1 BatD family protein [candidate division KSB1 bacterium]
MLSHRLRFAVFVIGLLLIGLSWDGRAQNTSSVVPAPSIRISAELDKKEVPLNRQVVCLVTVEWAGDVKRYQISEIQNPSVSNFEIVKTAAGDRRWTENGQVKAARTFEFVLQPKSLGMGYIENLVVSYVDSETGEAELLVAPRLNAKIIDPIPEPGSRGSWVRWLLIALVVVLIAIGLIVWQKKKQQQARKAAEAAKIIPLEEQFLQELRESVNLSSPELKLNDAFWSLSKIARRYLSQKYQLPALESTTENIIAELNRMSLDATLVNNIQEILTVSDLAKFAGNVTERSELDRTYTLLEAILERNLGVARDQKPLAKAHE